MSGMSDAVQHFDVAFYTPISSSNKGVELCRLANGILVLLISDPADTSVSSSVSVASGSHADPDEVLGLAHLCEHTILSAGSKKFPRSSHYHEIVAQNGGSHNAYTTGENTTFYFELPASNDSGELLFDKVLDTLASSFKNPVFSDSSINKEIYAIESEHNVNKASTPKQLYHATRLLANPRHPFSRFCTGNFATLCDEPNLHKVNVKATLCQYFKTNYDATRMALCLRGPQSLNALAKLAKKYFGDLPASRDRDPTRPPLKKRPSSGVASQDLHVRPLDFKNSKQQTQVQDAFVPDTSNLVAIQSSKNPVLRLVFPVSHKSTRLTSNDIVALSENWCDFFGDEGVGSLTHCLKTNNLINGVVASVAHFSAGNDGLTLEFTLTNLGWSSAQLIITVLFDLFIPRLIHDKTKDIAKCLSELNCTDLLTFLYQGAEKSSMEMCAVLSSRLLSVFETLDPKCLLKGSPLIECNQNPSAIGDYSESTESRTWWIGRAIKFQNFVSEFVNRQNLRIVMLGNCPKSDLLSSVTSVSKTDAYYEFTYQISKIDMLSVREELYRIPGFSFRVPCYDMFLPTVGRKLGLIKQALQASSNRSQTSLLTVVARNAYLQTIPRLAGKNSNHELWVKEEDSDLSFKSKSIISIEVASKTIEACPSYTMCLEVLAQLLGDSLSTVLYPSEKLGYTYEISPSAKGHARLSFTISGFPEGVCAMVRVIIDQTKSLINSDTVTPAMFRKARVAVRNKYEEAASANSTTLATLGLLIVLEECMWPVEDRLDALEEIDIESFRTFCSGFISKPTYLNVFSQGDLSYTEEISTFLDSGLTSHLSRRTWHEPAVREPVTHALKPGTNMFIRRSAFVEDPSSSIVYFIQTGDRDDAQMLSLTCLTEFLMSMTLVPDLRTKKQIGYAVFSGLRLLSTTMGLHITCMSSSPPEHLESQIDQYLAYMEHDVLSAMSEEEFQERYIRKFRAMFERENVTSTSDAAGPADLLAQIEANVHSGNLPEQGAAMRQHKRIRNQISIHRYNFTSDLEPADLGLLRALTLGQFRRFFQEKISICSTTRSKLSVMVASPVSADEIAEKRLFLQIESYLKLKGLKIPSSELRAIVESSQGKPSTLMRGLFKFFLARGETLRLCNVILKELSKAVVLSLKPRPTNNNSAGVLQNVRKEVSTAVPLIEVQANHFRQRSPVTG
ncbi:Axl1p [Lachancea thermotolerans CBS 6340]|uniref:KLTH0E05104p n=1 Tax=Lachancea thermotolerans (strain ATCC 56472 / CBS 6340 / NRRL Y-8284) TaxID=559295 RepID=C5DHK7_LACTC|nr:KLTH0E05104p [Lachancea thermotolerans CBS 6340]CAR23268.1 KLTH0E05104p [Lachancea thermotolerans CBS 6340]